MLESEPGHVGFAPGNAHELALLGQLWQRYPRISVEHLLSGPGLANLHWANSRLLGGEMELDVAGATAAVQTIGDAIGLDTEAAAEGILAIVNENMAGALRLVSVQRGYDPRDFALVAFGGAGPLHANAVAELMGSFPVIVPPSPGLLCAIGDLVAEFRNERHRSYYGHCRYDLLRGGPHGFLIRRKRFETIDCDAVQDGISIIL